MLTGLALLCLAHGPAYADRTRGGEAFAAGDYGTALREWRQAADEGDGSAMSAIGALYDVGRGVPQDFAQALSWYRRAAEAGNVPAMFNVGAMCLNGRGTAVDQAESLKWWRMAAERGDGRAAYAFAVMYRDGDSIPRDIGAAIRFFRAAAAAGLGAAQSNLAALGASAAPRITAAIQVPPIPVRRPPLTRESDRDLGRFQQVVLARGDVDATSSRVLSKLVPTLASQAAAGNELAEYDVGFAYEHGIGTTADPVKSYVYYLRATASRQQAIKAAAMRGASQVGAQLSDQQHAAAIGLLMETSQ